MLGWSSISLLVHLASRILSPIGNPKNFVCDKWADLHPSNYVSIAGSDDGPSDDMQKINFLDSNFNNFNFSEFGILGSGLSSSEAPHTDPFRMGTKNKLGGQEHASQQAISSPMASLKCIEVFPNFWPIMFYVLLEISIPCMICCWLIINIR